MRNKSYPLAAPKPARELTGAYTGGAFNVLLRVISRSENVVMCGMDLWFAD